jgi:hypothetical protein
MVYDFLDHREGWMDGTMFIICMANSDSGIWTFRE